MVRELPKPPDDSPVKLVLVMFFLLALPAAAAWLISTALQTSFPEFFTNVWNSRLLLFIVLFIAEFVVADFFLTPKCPKCGTRITTSALNTSIGSPLGAPVLWVRSFVPPRGGISLSFSTKCPKCGQEIEPGVSESGQFSGEFRKDK